MPAARRPGAVHPQARAAAVGARMAVPAKDAAILAPHPMGPVSPGTEVPLAEQWNGTPPGLRRVPMASMRENFGPVLYHQYVTKKKCDGRAKIGRKVLSWSPPAGSMLPMGKMGVSGVRHAIGALVTKLANSTIYTNPANRRGAVARPAYLQFSRRMPVGRPALRASVAVVTATALLAGTGSFAAPAGASPVPAGARTNVRPLGGSSAFDWPQLHLNPQLGGYAANGTVSTVNAAALGIRWATDLY